TFTANVAGHFVAVGQAYTRHLAQSRVRLFRRRRVHTGANTATLRTGLQRRHGVLDRLVLAALADQLIYSSHYGSFQSCFKSAVENNGAAHVRTAPERRRIVPSPPGFVNTTRRQKRYYSSSSCGA